MRALNLAASILNNQLGRVPRPSWCTYLVCYRCNARCGMCDSWRMRAGTELTPEQVRTVFGKIGRLDVVRLTGGEPFLREDMLDVATAVLEQSRPSVVHITTNGSYSDRVEAFVRGFSEPKKLRFMISFDGLEAEHDANRGDKVTFAMAEECVRRLAGLRSEFGVEVSINHTIISGQSLADHQEICRRFRAIDVDVHFVLAYADSAMYGAKRFGKKAEDLIVPTGYPLHPKLKDADCVGLVREQLRDMQGVDDWMLKVGKRYYLRGMLSRLREVENASPKPKCVALRSHIRLLPDGSVPVCQFNTEKVGNLLTQSFDEVWHGEQTQTSRKWVDRCPGCWAECEVMPSAIYSGNLALHVR